MAKSKPSRGSGGLRVKKLLVPVDFSKNSQHAINYAVSLAQSLGAELQLLHVVEPPPFMSALHHAVPLTLSNEQVAEKAQADLEALIVGRIEPAASARATVRVGKAYQEIIKAAEASKADMIVIASHGYTGLKHTIMGSVAERVVRHAPCPVLVIRGRH